MSFQLPAIRKLCQDACHRLRLPEPSLILYYLKLNIQALEAKRPVARLVKGDLLGICNSFLP